jgi:hypothetical protein
MAAQQLPPISDEVRAQITTEGARRAVREDAELTIARWEKMASLETSEESRAEWLTMAERLRSLLSS